MDTEIPVFNWFEEPIKSSVKSVFEGLNVGLEALDLFKKYRDVHLELLQAQVGGVKILGMQSSIKLQDLYYPAVVTTDIRRRIYAVDWQEAEGIKPNGSKLPKRATTLAQGDSYIAANKRVVVLGGPGAGKTTFSKFLALAYSNKQIFNRTKLKQTLLPIFLHLPAIAKDGKEIFNTFTDNLVARTDGNARHFIRRLLESGQCIVFFDSLDEVPKDYKILVVEKLKAFAAIYPRSSIVVSCRTADYEQNLESFAEVELAKLSNEGVTSIVRAWFSGERARADKLINLLAHDQAVASLTETPLLLSLLCIQFRNDLALPKRKAELFRRCVDALLRDWDTTRGFRRDTAYTNLSDDRKEKIFEAIAGSLAGDSIEYEIEEPKLLGAISDEIARYGLEPHDAPGILREIENHHGILEKCSAESYEFSHATMQDYFAARYIVSKRLEISFLKAHYEEEHWHTTITFVASILDDPTAYLQYLVDRSSTEQFQNYPTFGRRLSNLLLLYRCMAMGVSIAPATRIAICQHLVKSQVSMIRRINTDGVLPYAARSPSGVRQTLLRYNSPRATIEKILQPYRTLMNEIVLMPVSEYANEVFLEVERIHKSSKITYGEIGLLSCLMAPVSSIRPDLFYTSFMHYSKVLLDSKAESVRSIIVESISTHREMYPELFA
jgi:energy-coupling factor transporter ATP-binding protein EcfA2